MADKRMITKTIVDSDAFLDMPVSAQNLYFHLNVRADDEGFLNSPNKIMRMVGCNKNDLDILLAKKFVLGFESGIIVIKHWKLHNCIRKDRLKETVHTKERSMITEKDNGSYTFMSDNCQTSDGQVTDESLHRLDKVRLDKNSIDKYSIVNSDGTTLTLDEEDIYREQDHLSITIAEKERIEESFKRVDIDYYIDQVFNFTGNKKYSSLNLTVRNWIKRAGDNYQKLPLQIKKQEQEVLNF